VLEGILRNVWVNSPLFSYAFNLLEGTMRRASGLRPRIKLLNPRLAQLNKMIGKGPPPQKADFLFPPHPQVQEVG